jgi:hypothetical protein
LIGRITLKVNILMELDLSENSNNSGEEESKTQVAYSPDHASQSVSTTQDNLDELLSHP